jgi:hypothetical protein
MNPLEIALQQFQYKVIAADDVMRAAEAGARLVIVAAAAPSFEPPDAELLLDGDEQRIWVCPASPDRLIAWLADEAVIAVSADEQPEIRPSADASERPGHTTSIGEPGV